MTSKLRKFLKSRRVAWLAVAVLCWGGAWGMDHSGSSWWFLFAIAGAALAVFLRIQENREDRLAADTDKHPLDEALGQIHLTAIWLQMNGFSSQARGIAKAHEEIQGWLVKNDE